MNSTTRKTIEIAKIMAHRGFTLGGVEVHTPYGRTWEIAPVPVGCGRHADGHWGTRSGARGGFRLFEVDRDQETIDEHDAVEGDTWMAGELIDYLETIGQPKNDNKPT